MTDSVVREGNEHLCPRPFGEVDILWLNGGLGCDGESVAMTGATQPSVEDLVMGAIPGLPRVRLHNPFLAYENGDEFLNLFRRAAEGSIEPFILVVEGSIPDEGKGQVALVESIEQDYEGRNHLAVVLEDDPGRDLGMLRQPGHRFFFSAEEVEPLEESSDE